MRYYNLPRAGVFRKSFPEKIEIPPQIILPDWRLCRFRQFSMISPLGEVTSRPREIVSPSREVISLPRETNSPAQKLTSPSKETFSPALAVSSPEQSTTSTSKLHLLTRDFITDFASSAANIDDRVAV